MSTKKAQAIHLSFQVSYCWGGLLGGQRERFVLNCFSNSAAANALRADPHGFGSTVGSCCADLLEVGAELTTSLTSDFGTDATQILRFTASFDFVTHLRAFSAYLTDARHIFNSVLYFCYLKRGIIATVYRLTTA